MDINPLPLLDRIQQLIDNETEEIQKRIRNEIAVLETVIKHHNNDIGHYQNLIIGCTQRIHEISSRLRVPQNFNIKEQLDSLVQYFKTMNPDIEFIFNPPQSEVFIIYGIEYKISKVFESILENAIHAISKSTQRKISIELRNINDELGQKCVEIIISDSGCGIPACRRDFIFELGTSYWADQPGTGFGLWFARNIIRSADGDIHVKKSAVGEGTKFTIVFPAVELREHKNRYALPHDYSDPKYDYTQESWYLAPGRILQTINADFEEFRQQFHPDVVLMTVTDTEFRYVCGHLKPPPNMNMRRIRCVPKNSQTYYAGMFGKCSAVVVKQSEMGSGGVGGSQNTAHDAIRDWDPKALIMIGIAFGTDRERYQPADVLVADKIVPYEKQRVGANSIFRDVIPPTDRKLLNRFQNATEFSFKRPDGTDVQYHVGPILSGEKLIDEPEYKRELIKEFPNECIGGEMEGAGIYAAACHAGKEWIIVKGVSDWADGNKHDDYQEMAAAAAASLAFCVLNREYVL